MNVEIENLFHRVFRSHHHAVSPDWLMCALCMREYLMVYEMCMSLTLNRRLAIWHIKHAIETCNDMGVSHTYISNKLT